MFADVPPAVRWITQVLEEAGFETWAVGGAVRDRILGVAGEDWDLATRAPPHEVRRLFRRTVPVGIEHGTVGVLARDQRMYEVTTFRRDVETDGRRARVTFSESIEEDLSRRDFTINAIAWHPLRDELYDPYGGRDDLEVGVLRAVGVAAERFREDHLRLLRGVRFAGRFGLSIDPDTWSAACSAVDDTRNLSPERVREELMKVLSGVNPDITLELYRSSGIIGVLYPEVARHFALLGEGEAPMSWETRLAEVRCIPSSMPTLRVAAWLRDIVPIDVAALLVRLRFSNRDRDDIAGWADAGPVPHREAGDVELRRWLSRHGADNVGPVSRLEVARSVAVGGRGWETIAAWRRARVVLAAEPPLSVQDLAIGGGELKRLGLRPGPLFGDVLERLLDEVIDDPSRNTAEYLCDRAVAIAGGETGADG